MRRGQLHFVAEVDALKRLQNGTAATRSNRSKGFRKSYNKTNSLECLEGWVRLLRVGAVNRFLPSIGTRVSCSSSVHLHLALKKFPADVFLGEPLAGGK